MCHLILSLFSDPYGAPVLDLRPCCRLHQRSRLPYIDPDSNHLPGSVRHLRSTSFSSMSELARPLDRIHYIPTLCHYFRGCATAGPAGGGPGKWRPPPTPEQRAAMEEVKQKRAAGKGEFIKCLSDTNASVHSDPLLIERNPSFQNSPRQSQSNSYNRPQEGKSFGKYFQRSSTGARATFSPGLKGGSPCVKRAD